MSFLTNKLMMLFLPLILGPLTFIIMEGLKRASAAIDASPTWLKQFTVVFIASLIAWLASTLGFTLPCLSGTEGCSLVDLNEPAIKTALTALVAFVTHYGNSLKNKQ